MATLNVLSLFTGAGGLDLGLEGAGFDVAGCVERDAACRTTLAANTDWRLASQGDVELLKPAALLDEFGLARQEIALLAGGPPCQPFSKSGRWVTGTVPGMADPRARTLRCYFEILEAALPRTMLLESVKGLVARPREGGEEEHALGLVHESLASINRRQGTAYEPTVVHLDAADFGIPQHRERVFVVAERGGRLFTSPAATHGPRAPQGAPRRGTTWDVLGDLDHLPRDATLELTGTWAALLPSIPEGRNYLHHTRKGDGEPLFGWRRKYWSFLLKLAKARASWTIQAQPGPATGPFHWRNRKLSVREMARLQTFPDHHDFAGDYASARRQIGNAVPVALGEVLGLELRRQLLDDEAGRGPTSVPGQRSDCPPAEEPTAVPEQYRYLIGEHEDHPGAGAGPGATAHAERIAAGG
jgi:DNA (cytosine-5)-methyltransferase 1